MISLKPQDAHILTQWQLHFETSMWYYTFPVFVSILHIIYQDNADKKDFITDIKISKSVEYEWKVVFVWDPSFSMKNTR